MTSLSHRSSDAASSWMLAASACIHGICILAIIIFSGSIHKPQTPPVEPITRVKLVEPSPGPPVLEKIPTSVAREPEPSPPEEPVRLVEHTEPSEHIQAVVTAKAVERPAESIPVVKRKKRMRQVKAPIPPEKKPEKKAEKKPEKKPVEPVKKKEDPSEILAKKIAALREEVERKRSDAVATRSQAKTGAFAYRWRGRNRRKAQMRSTNNCSSGSRQCERELTRNGRYLRRTVIRIVSPWSAFK